MTRTKQFTAGLIAGVSLAAFGAAPLSAGHFTKLSPLHTMYGVSQFNYADVGRDNSVYLLNPNHVTQVAAVLAYNHFTALFVVDTGGKQDLDTGGILFFSSGDVSVGEEPEEFLACVVVLLTPHESLQVTTPFFEASTLGDTVVVETGDSFRGQPVSIGFTFTAPVTVGINTYSGSIGDTDANRDRTDHLKFILPGGSSAIAGFYKNFADGAKSISFDSATVGGIVGQGGTLNFSAAQLAAINGAGSWEVIPFDFQGGVTGVPNTYTIGLTVTRVTFNDSYVETIWSPVDPVRVRIGDDRKARRLADGLGGRTYTQAEDDLGEGSDVPGNDYLAHPGLFTLPRDDFDYLFDEFFWIQPSDQRQAAIDCICAGVFNLRFNPFNTDVSLKVFKPFGINCPPPPIIK